MSIKRGVLFPENQKEEPTLISERTINNIEKKSKVVLFSDLFFNTNDHRKRVNIMMFILTILLVVILAFAVRVFIKSRQEQVKEQSILVQKEINHCYKLLDFLKTFKDSKKSKANIKMKIDTKLDSLIIVRDNLKQK
jgi:uncharacterized protein HemX